MTKKILFISYDGLTDPLGQSQVIPYLAGLTKYGYCFTILSCEKPQRYALYKRDIEKLLSSFDVKWFPIVYHKKPPVLSSVYDVLMLKRKAKFLHSKESFDMVHTRAGIPSLIGLWMKKKFNVKFLHDVREFYADSRVDGGIWNLKNPLYKIIYKYFKRIEEEEVKHCDGMVCLTYAAKKIIQQRPQYSQKVFLEVIPCSVDMQLFDPERIDAHQKAAVRKQLNISANDVVISYLGSIGGWYLTNEMMMFYRIILDKNPNAKFLFISPHEPAIIIDIGVKFGIPKEKIIVHNAQRYEVPLLLSFSDYSVFFIKPCYSKQSSSPTKHGEIMAMGIPAISNSGVGDVDEIITGAKSGITLKNLNQQEFESVASLISDRIKFDSKIIRNGAREYYDLQKAIDSYKKIYTTILTKPA
ncbi:glycosyltransferase family 4 protein [Ginsengibacter hankyongi]|uniref:Glycosyltransferase family 4 protein n=1 Tax=Ginsengibacter hankyongi TaxID=2607284 RepID=A0A5J5IQE3_9BACT|nr:glycosyltransferase family 4 protein [Ginsengibacter hankyongi]KAA9041792.1 glycosyltransferase family 4 protein [Ginsengibacter hankyongi]